MLKTFPLAISTARSGTNKRSIGFCAYPRRPDELFQEKPGVRLWSGLNIEC
jgi:hypothetical protein